MKNSIAILVAAVALPALADQQFSELNNLVNAGICNSASADDSVNDQVPYARFLIRTTVPNAAIDIQVISLESEPIDFDPFVAVYCFEFDPSAPLDSLLTLDDDSAGYPNAFALSNGPPLAGAQYVVVVSSYSNWAPSQFGEFVVELGDGLEFVNCPADLNGDGVLDFFDVSAFLVAFNAMDPIADFNNDGFFDFFDVSSFLISYQAGCP